MVKGEVFQIQKFCLQDGPGIRTTVFLKGCPLRCTWCHNPECSLSNDKLENASELMSQTMSIEDVLSEVLKDRVFYENSGGGLTLSGGEPLCQHAFSLELLKAAKSKGLHTCVETCGHIDRQQLKEFLPYIDLFLYDWKVSDDTLHQKYTGVSHNKILENLYYLNQQKQAIILRCPIISPVNDVSSHFDTIARLANELEQIKQIHLEAYHDLGEEKKSRIGLRETTNTFSSPDAAEMEKWISYLQEHTSVPVRQL